MTKTDIFLQILFPRRRKLEGRVRNDRASVGWIRNLPHGRKRQRFSLGKFRTAGRNMALVMLMGLMPVYGAVPLNDTAVMDVNISRKGLTRLSVKGDGIQDIFVYPVISGEVALQDAVQLHKSGHVFMAPEGIKEPFYLTVITQKGHVQDLKISPMTQQSVPLILTLPESPQDPHDALQQERNVLEKYLLSALQGIPPRGFTHLPLSDASSRQIGNLAVTPLHLYGSDRYLLSVYDLENTGEQDLTLMAESFLSSSDLAVVFERPVLTPQSKIRMVIVSPRHEGLPVLSDDNPVLTEPLSPSPSPSSSPPTIKGDPA